MTRLSSAVTTSASSQTDAGISSCCNNWYFTNSSLSFVTSVDVVNGKSSLYLYINNLLRHQVALVSIYIPFHKIFSLQ